MRHIFPNTLLQTAMTITAIIVAIFVDNACYCYLPISFFSFLLLFRLKVVRLVSFLCVKQEYWKERYMNKMASSA